MEQETMKAIREAELAAEKIEKDAAAEGTSIVAQAKTEAAQTVEAAVAEEKAKAAETLESARKKGETMQHAALDAVKQEVASLHSVAKGKSSQAKKLILSELI